VTSAVQLISERGKRRGTH